MIHLTTSQIEQELGRRLKRRRLELNLSQETTALHSGLSRRTITAVEHGQGATLATLIGLMRTLGASWASACMTWVRVARAGSTATVCSRCRAMDSERSTGSAGASRNGSP